jgi:beta-lactamase regulating signal transducer with metallopeptidase domain
MTMRNTRYALLGFIGSLAAIIAGVEIVVFQKILRIVQASQESDCACANGALFSNPKDSAMMALGGMFILGIGAALLYATITTIRTRTMIRSLRSQRVVNDGRVVVFRATDQSSASQAFSFGFLHPMTAIEEQYSAALTAQEREAVISHEQYHVRHRDPLVFFMLEAAKRAFFFMPILRNLISLYRDACELEADEYAKRNDALGGALLKLRSIKENAIATAPFAAALRLRIERILHPETRPRFVIERKALMISFLLIFGMGILFIQNPSKADARGCQIRTSSAPCERSFPLFDVQNKTSYTP